MPDRGPLDGGAVDPRSPTMSSSFGRSFHTTSMAIQSGKEAHRRSPHRPHSRGGMAGDESQNDHFPANASPPAAGRAPDAANRAIISDQNFTRPDRVALPPGRPMPPRPDPRQASASASSAPPRRTMDTGADQRFEGAISQPRRRSRLPRSSSSRSRSVSIGASPNSPLPSQPIRREHADRHEPRDPDRRMERDSRRRRR